MKRVIIIVIDSLGVGAMKDAPKFGDRLSCNTLGNVAKFNGGLQLPNLSKLGLGNIIDVMGVPKEDAPLATYGKMLEVSHGKDTTTGHWELAGLILDTAFKTYPNGFPNELMDLFVKETKCGGYFGNKPASGTAIIEEYHTLHNQTRYPIIYTSADSVFQIAANIDVVPLEVLYSWCEIARTLLNQGYHCSRVIARPYQETPEGLKRIGEKRKDYSVLPPTGSILDKIKSNNGQVLGIGKIKDIFLGQGITHSIKTGSNKEGLESTIAALSRSLDIDNYAVCSENITPDKELIFTNLVDTDMLFGHRNDPKGYGSALEEIDNYLEKIIPLIKEDDLLIITADHGCDPTEPGTDHSREMVPLLMYNPAIESTNLGTKSSFTYVANKVANWLDVPTNPSWVN